MPEDGDVSVEGVTGRVVAKIDTPAGAIVIGGKGNNYQLDEMRGVAAVIDLGGDNTTTRAPSRSIGPCWWSSTWAATTSKATKPGVQGGAILGVSMLVNLDGDNVYEAQDVAQGSALAGVGILIDYGGHNHYSRRPPRARPGPRRHRHPHRPRRQERLITPPCGPKGSAARWASACWTTSAATTTTIAAACIANSYKPETPGYEGWGQGVGAGIRQVADGGIGVILNGGGHNVYEFDYLSHGGGYWCGLGFARDFGGNNQAPHLPQGLHGGERTRPALPTFRLRLGLPLRPGLLLRRPRQQRLRRHDHGHRHGLGLLGGRAVPVSPATTTTRPPAALTQGCGAQAGLGILFHYGGDYVY